MLNDVKQLFELGFAIIHLHHKTKRPIETKWATGARKNWQTLADQAKSALAGKPFNVGVRLGDPSVLKDGTFLAALDCDVKSTDAVHLKEMEKALGLAGFDWKSAPTVTSGRGGGSRHIYFRTEKPLTGYTFAQSEHLVRVLMPSAKNVTPKEQAAFTEAELKEGWRLRRAWMIDVMGTGRQAVLPPSIHPDTGKQYLWKNRLTKTSDLPLVTLIRPEKKTLVKDAPEFKSIEVDLLASNIPDWTADLILSGRGLDKYGGDASAALYAVTMSLINAGLTDQEIMAVLTDPEHAISETAYRHTQSSSRKRAAEWIFKYTVSKARYEKSAEKAFENDAEIDDPFRQLTPEEADAQERELLSWRDRLEMNPHNMKPKVSLRNVQIILDNYAPTALFYYDEFAQGEFYASTPPWARKEDPPEWKGREIRNIDIALVRAWFSSRFGFEPNEKIVSEGIALVARNNSVHPVRKYLDRIDWDGQPRLDTWLESYLGAKGPKKYLRAVGRKVLVAGVARILEPGIKWDHVMILEGAQGIGKSSACKILGGEWFSDTIGDISNKDVVEAMRGQWIVELGELAGMRRTDVEELKQFVTKRFDRVRKAFAPRAESYPRQCIFIGTTNRHDYLRDDTGNRRFLPVECGAVDFRRLSRDRDQLWAEAYHAWIDGEPLHLENQAVVEIATRIQKARLEADVWDEPIRTIVLSDDFAALRESGFSLFDLWKRFAVASDLDGTKLNLQTQHRLGRVLRGMGFDNKVRWIEGSAVRLWRISGASNKQE